ncbi:hypothetical protein EII12_10930 [Buchananella hordeovulneris]|nr:hypothetical protein EII12_10930 [Buchananella hordeovulneris]
MWKEIPEPILPPEAQAQAGFAEAELAAKYFVELELYVRQTNDIETWQKVIHPESSGGKNVVDRALKRQEKGIRLAYEGLSVDVLESGVAVESENNYRVYLTLSANREYSVNVEGGVVSDNGEISYFATVFIEHVDGRWRLINSGYDTHRPEEL